MSDYRTIPAIRPFPTGAVQCDRCGGHGCSGCEHCGWHADPKHPLGRKCLRYGCGQMIQPDRWGVYCSIKCANVDGLRKLPEEET